MLAACAVMVILVLATGHVRRTSLLRLVVLVIILLAGLRIASFIGLSGLSSAISQRVAEGVYDVTRLAGNWAGRLEQQKAAMALWQSNPWLGIGTDYYSTFGNWIDLGLPLVLVSVGIVGLVIDFALFFGCFLTGILVLRQGIKKDSVPLLVVGAVLPAQVVLMLVYQQWLDPRGFAILGFVSALAVVSPGIFRDSGKAEVALSSGIVRFGQKTFRHV
jgi:O-antigen ligase